MNMRYESLYQALAQCFFVALRISNKTIEQKFTLGCGLKFSNRLELRYANKRE